MILELRHRLLWMILFVLPFAALFILMARFNVAVPFSDDLYMAPHLERLLTGDILTAAEFQFNEHRAFASLVLNGLVAATGTWNIGLLMLVNPILAAGLVVVFHIIGRKSFVDLAQDDRYFLAFAVAVLATSLSFWEVWSHIFTLNLTLTNFSFLVAVLVLFIDKNESRALLMATLMCLIASFAAIHGLLVWPALLPLLAARRWSFTKKWWLVPAVTVLLWLVVIGLYMSRYEAPPMPVDIWYFLQNPLRFLYFFVISIGAPVFEIVLFVTAGMGALLLLGTVWFFYRALRRGVSWLHLSPWISIWLFGVGSALALTLGRAGVDLPWRATQSRFGLLTYLIPMVFMYMFYAAYPMKNQSQKWERVAVVGLMTALVIASGLYDIDFWNQRFLTLQEGRACALYYELAPTECLSKLGNGMTDGEKVRDFAPAVERLGGF